MSELLLVLSASKPGRGEEYRAWYRDQHLPDMRTVPGVAGGRFYAIASADAAGSWTFAARYPLKEPVGAVLGTLFARVAAGEIPLTDAIEGDAVLMLAATPIGPRVVADAQQDRTDGAIYVVLTNATPGDDDAFNAWYNRCHIPDVLAVPGFIAAQRFTVAPETAGKASPWRYLSLYEVAPETAAASMAELQARAGTDAMQLSPALSTTNVYTGLFALAA